MSPRRGRIVPSTREIDDHTLCVYIIYASSKRKSKESLKASSSPCIYLLKVSKVEVGHVLRCWNRGGEALKMTLVLLYLTPMIRNCPDPGS